MAPSSASTKKLAKVARSSKGRSIREQSNRGFHLTVAVIVLLGTLLVFYGRSQRVDAQAEPPRLSKDHWHVAFGIYLCDHFYGPLSDKLGDKVGVHSHEDGIIHIHPNSSLAAGDRAKLGLFLDEVGIKVSGAKLELPDKTVWETGKTACPNGKNGKLVLVKWDSADDKTTPPTVIDADIAGTRFINDRMAMTLAFVPDDEVANVPRPESIATLDNLSDVQQDANTGAVTGTEPGTGDVVNGTTSTVAGDGSTSSTSAPPADGSSTTAPATTAGGSTSTSGG